jgi:hypothetical protein
MFLIVALSYVLPALCSELQHRNLIPTHVLGHLESSVQYRCLKIRHQEITKHFLRIILGHLNNMVNSGNWL